MVASSIYMNPYTITLTPIVLSAIIIYLYKDDLRRFDYSQLFSRNTYEWAGNGFIIAMIGQGLCNLIFKLVSHEQPINLSMSMFNIPIIPLATVIFAPSVEELIFRRIIFGYLDKKFNFYSAAIISSIIFASAHMSIGLFAGYFLVGMTFCWAYKKSNSLLPSIISHTYINFLVIIVSSLKIHT